MSDYPDKQNGEHDQDTIDPDVPLLVQRTILLDEIQLWKNTRYQMTMRLRVQMRLRTHAMANEDAIKSLTIELERIEAVIGMLQEDLQEVQSALEKGVISDALPSA